MKVFNVPIVLTAILLLTFFSFWPCLGNNFVNWDDNQYVTENIIVQNFSINSVKTIFTSFFVGNYQPLTMLSYLFEFHFFKFIPWPYHLTNIILHLVNSVLVFWLMHVLTKRILIPTIVTLLFAIHPLHVEPVAWISSRKDLLYAVFFLAGMIAYTYFLRKRSTKKYYYLSLGMFILSLLSKPMALTLPFVLVLIDYLLHKGWDKNFFINKAPFFILTIIFGMIAIVSQFSINAIRDETPFNIPYKVEIACFAIIFYIIKILFPFNLSCLYPASLIKDTPLILCPFIIFIFFLCISRIPRGHREKIIFGSLFFIITLSPVLEFIPVGEPVVSDRYMYMPSIGLFYLIAEGMAGLRNWGMKYYPMPCLLGGSLFVVIIVLLVFLTQQRCQVWKDSLSLWNDVLKKYPHSATAYFQRGLFFINDQQPWMACQDFKDALDRSIKIDSNPQRLNYWLNLGICYRVIGNNNEALAILQQALNRYPNNHLVYLSIAQHYDALGLSDDASAYYQKTIDIQYDQAMQHYKKANLLEHQIESRLNDILKLLFPRNELPRATVSP